MSDLQPFDFPKRTIFCHPEDKQSLLYGVKAEDISVLTSTYVERHTFLAAKDITVEAFIDKQGYERGDFENNKWTIILAYSFY